MGSSPTAGTRQTSYFAVAKSEVFVYDLGGNPDGFPLRPLSFRNLKRVAKIFLSVFHSRKATPNVLPTNREYIFMFTLPIYLFEDNNSSKARQHKRFRLSGVFVFLLLYRKSRAQAVKIAVFTSLQSFLSFYRTCKKQGLG